MLKLLFPVLAYAVFRTCLCRICSPSVIPEHPVRKAVALQDLAAGCIAGFAPGNVAKYGVQAVHTERINKTSHFLLLGMGAFLSVGDTVSLRSPLQ